MLSPGGQATRERLGVEPVEIDAGHCPHVSRPERVADILERAEAAV
jgi:pimeloyl-ACP methyl ester carboxylesterase